MNTYIHSSKQEITIYFNYITHQLDFMLRKKFKNVVADIKSSNAKHLRRRMSLWAIATLIVWAIALSKILASLVW